MALLLAQCFATWAMTAVIWFVQLVQYPSFARVDLASFAEFHAFHSTRITWIVAPLMILEALTSLTVALRRPGFATGPEAWGGLALVALVWTLASLWIPVWGVREAGDRDLAVETVQRLIWDLVEAGDRLAVFF